MPEDTTKQTIREALDEMLSFDDIAFFDIYFDQDKFIQFTGSQTEDIRISVPLNPLDDDDVRALTTLLIEEHKIPLNIQPLIEDKTGKQPMTSYSEYGKHIGRDTEKAADLAWKVLQALDISSNISLSSIGTDEVSQTESQIDEGSQTEKKLKLTTPRGSLEFHYRGDSDSLKVDVSAMPSNCLFFNFDSKQLRELTEFLGGC